MNKNKSVLASVLALAAVGVAVGASSLAEASLSILSPTIGSGNVSLHPVGQKVELDSSSSFGNDAEMISVGTTSTSVSAQLVEGNSAQTFGYNSSRALISGCVATDTSTSGGAVVDPCVGVAFKQLIVSDNSP
jgi:hypothetical protein